MEAVAFFVYAFTSIFVIVNPIAGLVTFISLTTEMSTSERKETAGRAVMVACGLAVLFAISGELILRFFGITVDCLRVAGGVLLFIIALDMLHARVSRQRVTKEEIKDASKREDVSICPLAMPLLTGPATITTVIVLIKTGETMELKTIVILATLLTFIASYVIFRFANEIHRMLGVTGSL